MVKFAVALIICFSLVLSTGCAGTEKEIKKSGFLGDYPEFQPGPEGGADWVYLKEGVDFSVYRRVMIDRVMFFFREDAKYKGIHPEELQELSSAFLLEMTMALRGAGAYPSAEEPAPDVLRVRFAITDVVQSKPRLQVFSALLPADLPVSSFSTSKTGSHLGAGQASLEAELLDSMTNERIGAVIDTKTAGKFDLTDDETKWKHTRDAFQFWAQRFRTWLDDVHGKK